MRGRSCSSKDPGRWTGMVWPPTRLWDKVWYFWLVLDHRIRTTLWLASGFRSASFLMFTPHPQMLLIEGNSTNGTWSKQNNNGKGTVVFRLFFKARSFTLIFEASWVRESQGGEMPAHSLLLWLKQTLYFREKHFNLKMFCFKWFRKIRYLHIWICESILQHLWKNGIKY